MITLGTLTLLDLAWTDQWATAAVAAPVRRRLDGGLAVYPRTLSAGRPITLVATADQPLTYAQANTLAAMAAVPGATYPLNMTLKSFSALVMFDWSQGPALDLSLVIDYADPATTDPVSGTLHLLTV
jgi:hypothetical protein